jgi:hypothetical protein
MGARCTHTGPRIRTHDGNMTTADTENLVYIHPQLRSLAVALASLTPDPRNARGHDERNIEAVRQSLQEHGQRKPVVVQRRGADLIVRAGNATCEAARRLGWQSVAAVVVDEGDKDAIKYALRDNRTAELAEWDLPNLGAELRVLRDEGVALETIGWEAYEYTPLMEAEWTPPGVSGEDFTVPDKRVGIMFTRDEFERLKTFLGCKPTADEIIKRLGVPTER